MWIAIAVTLTMSTMGLLLFFKIVDMMKNVEDFLGKD